MIFCQTYNKNIQKILKFIKNKQNYDFYVLVSHENPDSDAVSSVIALEYLLSLYNKTAICLNSDRLASNLIFFDYRKIYSSYEDAVSRIYSNSNLGKKFCLIMLDTHEMRLTGKFGESDIPAMAAETFCIDHHIVQENQQADNIFSESSKSSVCEIIYDIYKALGVEIPKEVGDALYAGMMGDTGAFHYPKTTADTLLAASNLVRGGTIPNDIHQQLYEHESISELLLKKYVWSTLELYHGGRIAVLTLTKEMLEQSEADYNQTGELVNLPLVCADVQVVIFCKENEHGKKKIAVRSKGDINIAEIIQEHGGGGHRNAAGFKLFPDEEFDDVKNILIEEISKIL